MTLDWTSLLMQLGAQTHLKRVQADPIWPDSKTIDDVFRHAPVYRCGATDYQFDAARPATLLVRDGPDRFRMERGPNPAQPARNADAMVIITTGKGEVDFLTTDEELRLFDRTLARLPAIGPDKPTPMRRMEF